MDELLVILNTKNIEYNKVNIINDSMTMLTIVYNKFNIQLFVYKNCARVLFNINALQLVVFKSMNYELIIKLFEKLALYFKQFGNTFDALIENNNFILISDEIFIIASNKMFSAHKNR